MCRACALFLFLAFTSLVAAEDSWPQFRGPGGTGISRSTGLPPTWDENTNVTWKTAIHDKGWSSPVVLGRQVWLTTAREDGKAQWAVCVDRATGRVVHDLKVFDTPKPPYFAFDKFNSHASPSPVIEKGRVYVHFGSAGTACIDTTSGKTLWSRRDLPCNHFRGPGSSPILWKDLLIVSFDGHDRQYIAALYTANGKTAWTTDRNLTAKATDGDAKKAFGTATVIEVGGKPQVVSSAAGGTVAYDPRTGEEIWKVYHGGMNAATPPQFGNGKVFVTTGDGPTKLLAIRPDGSGDVTKTHVDYGLSNAPKKAAPILLGDLLFTLTDDGHARCLEAKTGRVVKSTRVPGNYYASPVLADGRLYCFNLAGEGTVLTADRNLKRMAVNQLKGEIRATPAIAGKALFVRTDTHLYRIEKK